ncbi:unnamed protein product, partial [Iphiclides podalirius]
MHLVRKGQSPFGGSLFRLSVGNRSGVVRRRGEGGGGDLTRAPQGQGPQGARILARTFAQPPACRCVHSLTNRQRSLGHRRRINRRTFPSRTAGGVQVQSEQKDLRFRWVCPGRIGKKTHRDAAMRADVCKHVCAVM